MPKQPLFESFRHHFLLNARILADKERQVNLSSYSRWYDFISSLDFKPGATGFIHVTWTSPNSGERMIPTKDIIWYFRGDTKDFAANQKKQKLVFHDDEIHKKNQQWFLSTVAETGKLAGLTLGKKTEKYTEFDEDLAKHFAAEEELFDIWAKETDPKHVDVIRANESPTAPELRFITKYLGDIRGKTLLDVGSGLGEASIYFAIKGAEVTALDLSNEMLKVTQKLAKKYKVKVTTIQSTIEYLNLPKTQFFDIVYVGNLFHHVNIPLALNQITSHLKPGGSLVCWEPVAYNPAINLYRKMAHEVRSDDERPFEMKDIAIFHKYFKKVKVKWFWLTTLIIFPLMVFFMRRDPNKIRLWKKVVEEGHAWAPVYYPLEFIDKILLTVFPFLGPLCWNVVLICTKPKQRYTAKLKRRVVNS